ncbi:MAG: DUF4280 domain-containing protein [Pseudomonadota bacterium]
MATETVSTAQCSCSMGDTHSNFTVSPDKRVEGESKPAANIMDNKLGVNFPVLVGTFGKCKSLLFPDTAKATAEKNGVLDPQDCQPIFAAPWMPGAMTVHIGGAPALSSTSVLMCTFAGSISVSYPGETTFMVP